jgi:dTDP-4-amino-4,6-dideoxygalactose transaminase
VLSFHATKVFNTFEGGAIVSPDAKTKLRIDRLKNFGFVDETTVVAPGINGKMSEINAALGLLQLKAVDAAIDARARVAKNYTAGLRHVPGISCLHEWKGEASNYSYFPILVGPEYAMSRDELYEHLKQQGIFARRYFYPLISSFPMYRDMPSAAPNRLPVATRAAQQVLCIPIFPDLSEDNQQRIIDLVVRGAVRSTPGIA